MYDMEFRDYVNGQFVFNLQEKEEIGLWGRMGGRKPRWLNIM